MSFEELGINRLQCSGKLRGFSAFLITLAKRERLSDALLLCNRDLPYYGYRAHARMSLLQKQDSAEYIAIFDALQRFLCLFPADEVNAPEGSIVLDEGLQLFLGTLKDYHAASEKLLSEHATPTSYRNVTTTCAPVRAAAIFRSVMPGYSLAHQTDPLEHPSRRALKEDFERRVFGFASANITPGSDDDTEVVEPSPAHYTSPPGSPVGCMAVRTLRFRKESPCSSIGSAQKSLPVCDESCGEESNTILERLSRPRDSDLRRSTAGCFTTPTVSKDMRLRAHFSGSEVLPRKLFKSSCDNHKSSSPVELLAGSSVRKSRLQRSQASGASSERSREVSREPKRSLRHSSSSSVSSDDDSGSELPESCGSPWSAIRRGKLRYRGVLGRDSDDDEGEELGNVDSPRSISDEECDSGIASEYTGTSPTLEPTTPLSKRLQWVVKADSKPIKKREAGRSNEYRCHSQKSKF